MNVAVCGTVFMEYCKDTGLSHDCSCYRDYNVIVDRLAKVSYWIRAVRSDNRAMEIINKLDFQYKCVFVEATFRALAVIAQRLKECQELCTRDNQEIIYKKRECPEALYCGDPITQLYKRDGNIFRNPDLIIVTTKDITLIIEEKSEAGNRSLSRLVEQLRSSFINLPDSLRKSCSFIALIPEKGGLPKGLEIDRKTRLLKLQGVKGLFWPPTLYLHGLKSRLDYFYQ